MIKNFLKITWRNILQHKGYSAITVFGLVVGMCACILISLYVKEELSFDDYHNNSERIAIVSTEHAFFGKMLNTPYPLAESISNELPQVDYVTQIRDSSPLRLSRNIKNYIEVAEVKYADSNFFNVFSYDLIFGSKKEALLAPNTIVLTQESSRRLFGDLNPIGESIGWAQRDTLVYLEVSGVIENPPSNTVIPFNALLSMNTLSESRRPPDAWGMFSFNTYVLVNSAGLFKNSDEQLSAIANAKYDEFKEKPTFSFIPITELHLSGLANREGFSGSTKYLYFFGTIALFILLIASVNYVNLATARVSTRFKEIGIRKTLGAQRSQIALQFLGESIFLCLVAFVLSVSLAEFLLPFFNDLFGTNLVWEKNSAFLLFSAIGAVLVGVLAGLYPSFYLSKFSPSDVLKSIHTSGSSGTLLRKSLVVSQFAIALILIIGSLVIFKQLEYAQSKDLGFEGEQVMVIELPNKIATQKKNTIVNNLRNRSGVISATISDAIPGSFGASFIMSPDDLSPDHNVPGNTKEIEYSIHLYPAIVDYHYFETLNMSLIAGRNFSEDYPSDFENGYIINEKAAEALGWKPVEAVGKTFGIKKEGTVIGVVSNFHLKSLHEDIPPVSFQLHAGTNWSNTEKIAVKVTPDNIPNVINDLKEVFAEYTPYQTLNYEFLDDKFDAMYRTEKRLGQISGLFTVIAIFIACLGLFGLAAYSAERRTKEIGIRKALGASITNILALLSKDFVKLVILGFMFAIPISWYAMNQWLADFAYRIEIGPGIFALAGGTALVIALLTVSWQSIKAALANPVESLRSE